MSNINYGVGFCKRMIKILEDKENNLFAISGYGFDKFSREYIALSIWKARLKQFTYEKDNGLSPSYNPTIHGGAE